MHDLYKLKDALVKELKGYGKSGDLSKSSLEMIDKLAHATKNLEKVIECCEEEEYSMGRGMGGYSRRGGYSMRGSYADGRSYMDGSYADSYADGDYRAADGVRNYVRPDGSYADMSYARGRGAGAKRDAMGRYSSEGGVDEHTKEELRKLIEKM